MTISLQFHGATEGVTGSCHQISFKDESVLIDCGIFQGKEARGHNDLKIDFDISNLKGLAITHAHIDHIGRLPYLLAAGGNDSFGAFIFNTQKPNRMLLDS